MWPNEQMKQAHPQLVRDLNAFKAHVAEVAEAGLGAAPEPQVRQLRRTIVHLRDFCIAMAAHLDEEEEVGLAFLRRHATRRDTAPVEKRIVDDMSRDPALAHWFFFWAAHDGADRDSQMAVFGVPAPGRLLVGRALRRLRGPGGLVGRLEALAARGRAGEAIDPGEMIYDRVRGAAFSSRTYAVPAHGGKGQKASLDYQHSPAASMPRQAGEDEHGSHELEFEEAPVLPADGGAAAADGPADGPAAAEAPEEPAEEPAAALGGTPAAAQAAGVVAVGA